MSAIDDIRKLMQDFLAPELRAIRGEIGLVNERVKHLEEKMDLRFDAVMKELATDKRIERLEQLVAKQTNETKDAAQ